MSTVAQPNQPDPTELPAEAIEAAANAICDDVTDTSDARHVAVAALRAALPHLSSVGRDAARDALDEVERIVKAEAGAGDVYMRPDVLSVISQVRRARAEGLTP